MNIQPADVWTVVPVASDPAQEFYALERDTDRMYACMLRLVGRSPLNLPRIRFRDGTGADAAQVRLPECGTCAPCLELAQSIKDAATRTATQPDDALVASPAGYSVNLQLARALLPCTFINAHRLGDAFIFTQAPMCQSANGVDTMASFWRMVWQERAAVVVCLARPGDLPTQWFLSVARDTTSDKQNRAFLRYWPGPEREEEYGGVIVALQYTTTCGVCMPAGDALAYKVLHVSVRDKLSGPLSAVSVRLVLYEDWPDGGVPRSAAAFVAFVERVDELWRAAQRSAPKMRPVVMHCVAGMGRAGVMGAALHMSRQDAAPLQVYNTVMTLRGCGRRLVQTAEQYAFLHRVADVLQTRSAAAHREAVFLQHGSDSLLLPAASTDKK